MSINTAHAAGGVLIFCGERILIFYDGIEMKFEGNSQPQFKGSKKGRVYLTTHRVIYNCSNSKDSLQSVSMPFLCMKDLKLEQPVFGANYISGTLTAESAGQFTGTVKFKMWFNKGGAIEFGQTMLRAGELASRNRPAQPPSYSAAATGGYYQAPPPMYAPSQEPLYGFVPYQTFPTAPPAEGVYMTEAPPPYPGVDPNMTYPSAPSAGQYNTATANAKAAEAAASSGYYSPHSPHNIYVPTAAPPPSYDDITKKQN